MASPGTLNGQPAAPCDNLSINTNSLPAFPTVGQHTSFPFGAVDSSSCVTCLNQGKVSRKLKVNSQLACLFCSSDEP